MYIDRECWIVQHKDVLYISICLITNCKNYLISDSKIKYKCSKRQSIELICIL